MKMAPSEIVALSRIIEELDYYQLLDVRRDAGAGELKRAYHASSRNFHPDANRHLEGELRAASHVIAKRITEAYAVLRDPRRRQAYDRSLESGAGDESSNAPVKAAAASPDAKKAEPKKPRQERPLPAFSGWTLDDQRLDISTRIGKRMVVYFFDPANAANAPVSDAIARVAKLGGQYNFDVAGVAVGSSRPKSKAYTAEHGIEFPVIDD